MRLARALALLGLLVLGCGKNPTGVANPPPKEAWIGTFAGASGQGDFVLDLKQTGPALAGEIIFGPSGGAPYTYARVNGSMTSDSMFLALDPAHSSTPTDLSWRARVLPDGTLSGRMRLVSGSIDAVVLGRGLPRRRVDTDATRDLAATVLAIEYDGSRLWLSTLNDYVRLDAVTGAIVDTIAIYHDPLPAHWTSSALMYDGALLWGVYPISIIGPGGISNFADLLAFDANGRAPDSLRIGHRPVGLAYDGARSWSLRSDPTALIGLDGTGAATDSLHVGIPDAVHLAFDGTRFWTLGWQLQRLYEIDVNGDVVSIGDLPGAAVGPSGLAVQGSYIWYAAARLGATTLYRMTAR